MGKQKTGKIRKYLALVCEAPVDAISKSPLDKDQLEFDFTKNGNKAKDAENGED